MSLNPRIHQDLGVWYLKWDADPKAIAYDIVTSSGAHVQAGKTKTTAKLGTTKPDPLPKIAPAYAQTYETAVDPTAPPPPPPPPTSTVPRYGISTGANPTNAVLDQCRDLGADYVRFDYGHGSTDIARVTRVNSNGQVCLLILPKRNPNGLGTTIASYWRTRLGLRWYEVMNEPDLNGWTSTVYAATAKRWCDELRAADPDCLISLPGHFKGRDLATGPTDYCRHVCATGCDFDLWSVHYADDDNWNNPGSGWHILYPHGDRAPGDTIHEILDANGRSHVPIMSSESHAFYREGAQGQAAKVTRFLNYTKTAPTAQSKPLASVAIYRVDYNEGGSFDSSLLNPDGSHRPAWSAFKAAVS